MDRRVLPGRLGGRVEDVFTLFTNNFSETWCHTTGFLALEHCCLLSCTRRLRLDFYRARVGTGCLWHLHVRALAGSGSGARRWCRHVRADKPPPCRNPESRRAAPGGRRLLLCLAAAIPPHPALLFAIPAAGLPSS